MIDRVLMTRSPSLRFALMFLGLPVLWLFWMGWVILVGASRALFEREV